MKTMCKTCKGLGVVPVKPTAADSHRCPDCLGRGVRLGPQTDLQKTQPPKEK